MTASEIDFDHFDLDHFDRVFGGCGGGCLRIGVRPHFFWRFFEFFLCRFVLFPYIWGRIFKIGVKDEEKNQKNPAKAEKTVKTRLFKGKYFANERANALLRFFARQRLKVNFHRLPPKSPLSLYDVSFCKIENCFQRKIAFRVKYMRSESSLCKITSCLDNHFMRPFSSSECEVRVEQKMKQFYDEHRESIFNFDIGYHVVIDERPMATAGARSQALPRGYQHKNEVRANSKYFP